MSTTLKDRRIGIVRMPIEFINSDPETVRAMMAEVIVVKAEFQVPHDRVEYVCICDDFITNAARQRHRRSTTSFIAGMMAGCD